MHRTGTIRHRSNRDRPHGRTGGFVFTLLDICDEVYIGKGGATSLMEKI